jgi:hypothetical protein
VVLPGFVPYERLVGVSAVSDTFGLLLWWDVHLEGVPLDQLWLAAVLAAAVGGLLFVLVPRRLALALPALVLASVFSVILTTSAVGAWFVALILGRTTAGLQELGTFCLRYQLETSAYLMLLTPRYPRLEPAPPPPEQLLIPGL